jgi:4-carboxymuconolactone decarboxylase
MEAYYDPADLAAFSEIGKDAPELAKKFFDYYAEVFKEGELTEREKALIALAVGDAVQCSYCIDAYTRACLEKGSSLGEMTEAVHVAAAIRGGGDPWRRVPLKRDPDAENRRKTFHVGKG